MLHVRHLPIAKTCRHAFLLLSNMLNWDWDDYCPNYCRFGIWLVARRPIPTYVQRNLTRTSSTMILELHMSRCSCTQNITWEYLFQLRCFFFCLTLAVWYLSHLSIYQFIYLSTNLPIHFPTYVQNRCTYLFTIFEQWKLCKQKWFKISHKPTICPPCPKSVGFQPCGTQRLRHQKKQTIQNSHGFSEKLPDFILQFHGHRKIIKEVGHLKLSLRSRDGRVTVEVHAAKPLILGGYF